MSVQPEVESTSSAPLDRRAARRQESKDEIIAAAWDLVRDEGLAGLTMRDLGKRVGMKAQSIYSYFASKHEIYDAMFHQGYQAFAAATADAWATSGNNAEVAEDPLASARRAAHSFFEFCTSDPVRYQLLFQRTIPDFVPSEESYAVAVAGYDAMAAQLASFGVTESESVDLWTAVLTGLSDQQISNDPGGDRWERVIDRAVEMALREIAPQLFEPSTPNPQIPNPSTGRRKSR